MKTNDGEVKLLVQDTGSSMKKTILGFPVIRYSEGIYGKFQKNAVIDAGDILDAEVPNEPEERIEKD